VLLNKIASIKLLQPVEVIYNYRTMKLPFKTYMMTFLLFASCAVTEKILVEMPVNAETREEFIVALNEVLIDTRAYAGCREAAIWINEQDADKVWIYEEWESRAHQEAYVNWRGETGNTSHLGPYINGEMRFLWLSKR
jgi:quinol monooxygenase YgiN